LQLFQELKNRGGKAMYIIQAKLHNENKEYEDYAATENKEKAINVLESVVDDYQNGRLVEVKAEAKVEIKNYFDDKGSIEKNVPFKANRDIEVNDQMLKDAMEEASKDLEDEVKESPCKGEICAHYDNGECESFDDIDDPILNREGECHGFDSKYKTDSEELKDLPDDAKKIIDVMLDQAMLRGETPTLSQIVEEGVKRHEVYKHFNGYKEACKIAGLEVNSGVDSYSN